MTFSRRGSAIVLGLLLSGSTLLPAAVKYQTETGAIIDVLPQVLVKYKSGTNPLSKIHGMRSINVSVLSVPSSQTVESMVKRLKLDPNVEYAEPNGIFRMFSSPNDTLYTSQYALTANKINVEPAWDITLGSNTVVVAVIDTGITPAHSDLVNQLWANPHVSGNSGAYGTQIEIDWNGDGDCLDTDPDLGPEQCASPTPIDDNTGEFHGTRVSGIIAAETNNSNGIAGIARNSRIMAIKALNADGSGSFEGIAEGILYAVNNGASVINMSLGGPSSSRAVADAVDYATAHNVVVVAAAGNGGNAQSVNFPASLSKVIAVGATDSSNVLAYFSCTGRALDVVAPGVGILSSIPPNTYSSAGGDGTSFSAPMVAGVAALLRSINPTTVEQSMSIDDVTRYIDFSATDLGSGGFDTAYGFGLLNAGAALAYAANGALPVPTASPSDTYPIPNPYRPLSDGKAQLVLPANLQSAASKEIKIFSISGERVRTLTNTTEWDGRNDDGSVVATGLYIYYVDTSLGTAKGKVTVMK